jgi:hypothetical protein
VRPGCVHKLRSANGEYRADEVDRMTVADDRLWQIVLQKSENAG